MIRDANSRPWVMLAVLASAELLGMSPWFTASAVGHTAILTTAVQIGFVVGTAVAAFANLADIIPAKVYFAISALAAALANAGFIAASGIESAIASRFLTGFFLTGVYPPAIKMAATWFKSQRGLALGTVVGALTIGKALPYLVRTFGATAPSSVVLAASGCAIAASVLVGLFYQDGPYGFERRPFSFGLVGTVIRHREAWLAISGYLGHMWELYAMWTWIPAFLAASIGRRIDAVSFLAIAVGGAGCIWGGWAADRMGRDRLVILAMAVSGVCSVVIGLLFGGNPWLVAAVAWVWGFFVVADSAQFSAMVTEVAPRHAVGTALTLQTSLGFLLTGVTIQGIPVLVASVGWRWAFAVLALGPIVGIAAIRRRAPRPR